MSVLLGNGDGSFGSHTDYPMTIDHVLVTDFDGDGNLDVITTGVDNEILFGAGDGTFACVARFALGGYMDNIAVGDVNGDGRLDLLASPSPGFGSSAEGVYVFLNPGR